MEWKAKGANASLTGTKAKLVPQFKLILEKHNIYFNKYLDSILVFFLVLL